MNKSDGEQEYDVCEQHASYLFRIIKLVDGMPNVLMDKLDGLAQK